MEWFVKMFEFELPRKAIRLGTAGLGSDVDEAVYDVDGFRIFLKGNGQNRRVEVFYGGEEVLVYDRTGDFVEVHVNNITPPESL